MLKILDRYIIKKFLTTFFFMLGVIMMLSMVFDISERLGDFIDKKAPISKIFTDYYLNFLIYYGNTFSSMIIFVSVIWFTAKMAQDTEIIPMLYSGKPFTRILRPYMISATLLVIIALIVNHFILPSSNRSRLDFEENYYRDRMFVENYHAEFPANNFIYYKSYYSDEDRFQDLVLETWKGNMPHTFLYAESAKYNPKKKNWTLLNAYVRKINNTFLDSINDERKNHVDEIHTYRSLDTTFSFQKNDIAFRENRVETMKYKELKEFIRIEKMKGTAAVPFYEIELYGRTSYPFGTYILTLIGVAVSSKKSRGGIGANIAVGLAFVFIYIFTMKITTVATMNIGFPSYIAVWTPNFIFGIIGIWLYRRMPK